MTKTNTKFNDITDKSIAYLRKTDEVIDAVTTTVGKAGKLTDKTQEVTEKVNTTIDTIDDTIQVAKEFDKKYQVSEKMSEHLPKIADNIYKVAMHVAVGGLITLGTAGFLLYYALK